MTTSILRITDGTTTKTFSTGDDMKLMTFEPRASLDGSNVDENARVDLVGSTSTNRTNIDAINRLFQQARNYARTMTGPRVYIEFDPGTSGTAWRSRVLDGNIIVNDTILGPWQYDTRMQVTIQWTRQPFWEGALTQVPLTNSSATNDTAGITVTNCNNGSDENWVSVNDSDILGDLPAPVKLQMYNSKSGSDAAKEIYVFHNAYSTPASMTQVLEGEDATGATVTDTSDATSSGGYYAALAWTATTETLIATWALSSAELTKYAGGRFAVVARWAEAFPYSNCYLRLEMQATSGNTLWRGNLSLVNSGDGELTLLDTLRLPPYLMGQASLSGINFRLFALRNQSGTHTLKLDYLHIGAITGDGSWQHFLSVNNGVAYQQYLVHDEPEEITYRIDGSSDIISEFQTFGGPILLIPNQDQKLYFLSCDYNGLAKIDQTWTIKLWYRPRYNIL